MRAAKSKRLTTQPNNDLKITKFRMSQLIQTPSRSIIQSKNLQPFADRKNRLLQIQSKATIKLSTKRTCIQSSRNIRQISAVLNLNRILKSEAIEYTQMILIQIEQSKRFKEKNPTEISQALKEIFLLSQKMNEEIYSYKNIQQEMIKLHEFAQILGSRTLSYKSFSFSAFTLYQYSSYSLSLYYFDRALKSFYDRQKHSYNAIQKYHEIQIYKFICKIFLDKQKYQEAKKFAFKFLRKCWIMKNVDEQMIGYDLLGKIYMQLQDINMSRYFHHRMSSGQGENPQILMMSKYNISKQLQEKANFLCYETINIFVQKDAAFNDILQNHYKMRSIEYSKDDKMQINQTRQIYIYTHHSPNRLLNNYHILERKMIEARRSKQLHFIRPRDSHRLRKLFSQYSSLLHEIKHKFHHTSITQEFALSFQPSIL